MAFRLVAAAASSSSSASSPMARLISRRGLAGSADYWPPKPKVNLWEKPKVNLWEDPKSPMRWKMSHFVVATLTVWGVLVSGGLVLFGENKEVTKIRHFAAFRDLFPTAKFLSDSGLLSAAMQAGGMDKRMLISRRETPLKP